MPNHQTDSFTSEALACLQQLTSNQQSEFRPDSLKPLKSWS